MAIGSAGYKLPKSLGAMMDGMPTLQAKDTMRRFLFDSAAEMIGDFFPDPAKHRIIQASLAAMAIDGTGVGPYTPGTAWSLGLHIAPVAAGVHYRLVKGGMGMFSEAMRRGLLEKGGEVKLTTPVESDLAGGRQSHWCAAQKRREDQRQSGAVESRRHGHLQKAGGRR